MIFSVCNKVLYERVLVGVPGCRPAPCLGGSEKVHFLFLGCIGVGKGVYFRRVGKNVDFIILSEKWPSKILLSEIWFSKKVAALNYRGLS